MNAASRTMLNLPRLLIGLTLLVTGVAKLLDLPGFAEVLGHYQLFPAFLTTLLAYTLPFVELAIGLSLLLAWKEQLGTLAAIVLHIGFIVVLTITLIRGIPIMNCGCFGVFWPRPLTWGTILEDVVMLMFSIGAWMAWKIKTQR